MTIEFKPLGDNVLIDYGDEKEEKTKGGIIMTTRERPQQGTVVAVGKGKKYSNGVRGNMTVKVGDKVLYGKYAGTELKLDGKDYLIMREEDILAII